MKDRQSGRSQLGYRCNLEKVGQYQGVGAGWQNAWYGTCDYYDTAQNQIAPGVQVLDVRDPAHPTPTTTLTSPAMLGPWESLKVAPQRGLLAAVAAYDGGGAGPLFFDVYDVKSDCTHPKQLASVPLNIPIGHEGTWSEDGMTYFGSATSTGTVAAIDVKDPVNPALITIMHTPTHGLSTSDDGNRLYTANPGLTGGGNGLDIYDISGVQARTTAAQPRLLGSTYWTDGTTAQHTIPIQYGTHKYILFFDEGGAGAARIIDIADEKNPRVVTKLKLAIHMPKAADLRAAETAGNGIFGYEGHYCAVDRKHDPTAVACGYFQSGIRVFDIRTPLHPHEIAYCNPPAQVASTGRCPGRSTRAGSATPAEPTPGRSTTSPRTGAVRRSASTTRPMERGSCGANARTTGS